MRFRGFIRHFLATSLALGILGVMIWIAYRLLHVMVSSASKLGTQVWLTVLTPSITALASVLTIVVGRYLERKMAVESHLRTRRIPVYERFVQFWFELLLSDQNEIQRQAHHHEQNMKDFFRDFTQKALLWASDDVLARYAAFRRSALSSGSNGKYDSEGLFAFEDLLFAFRRDLGYKNKMLKRGDLLAQFVVDIDKHLPKREHNR